MGINMLRGIKWYVVSFWAELCCFYVSQASVQGSWMKERECFWANSPPQCFFTCELSFSHVLSFSFVRWYRTCNRLEQYNLSVLWISCRELSLLCCEPANLGSLLTSLHSNHTWNSNCLGQRRFFGKSGWECTVDQPLQRPRSISRR